MVQVPALGGYYTPQRVNGSLQVLSERPRIPRVSSRKGYSKGKHILLIGNRQVSNTLGW